MRNKKINIILYSILIIIIIFSSLFFLFYEDGLENMKLSNKQYSECLSRTNTSNEIDKNTNTNFELSIEECHEIVSYPTSTNSAFYIFNNILRSSVSLFVFPYFVPLLILFPFIYIISKKFRSKDIKNYIVRDTYRNYIKKIFKTAYYNIWIIPLIIVLLFLFSMLITKNLNPLADINYMYLAPLIGNLFNKPWFYFIYILIIFLNIGMYINVGLMVLSRNKNFIIAYIESFLLIYLIWCISDVILGVFAQKYLSLQASNFSLLNIYVWVDITNIPVFLLVSVGWFIITLITAVICYKNKEKIIIMCEK